MTKLDNLLTQARQERDELMQLNQYTHAVLEMKQATLSELVSYNKPLPVIHDVLVATLRLLGEDMETLQVIHDSFIKNMLGYVCLTKRFVSCMSTYFCSHFTVIIEYVFVNRKEGNDQESIWLPNTFRPRHQTERSMHLKQRHHNQNTTNWKTKRRVSFPKIGQNGYPKK